QAHEELPGVYERGDYAMRYIIREKFFRLGEDSSIMNEAGQPVLDVDGKVLSLRNQLIVRDMRGNEVVRVQRKLLAIRPTYEIIRDGQELAEVRKHLISPVVDRFTVDIPGPDDLHITGSLFEHEYTFSRGGRIVATVSKRWFSLRDTYGVDIAPGEDDVLILACVLALDLAEDRERAQDND
ncbi:MAG: LURP-one-related/scramblase family protein, partial [Ktedonobacteraceae bacterium]